MIEIKAKPFFQTDLGTLYNNDCLNMLKQIPNESIDLILTDPPYGQTACNWDKIINFDLLWKQLNRIIKKDRVIILFGNEPFSSKTRLSNLELYKFDYIWIKTKVSGFTNAKNKPLNTYENIMIFSYGSCANGSKNKMKYNPQGLKPYNKNINGRRKQKDEHNFYKKCNDKNYIREFTNYPKNTLFFNTTQETDHPTEKPIKLIEYLIKTYSDKNNLVLDFTSGSGTTAVASENLDRRWICIEKELKYCEMSKHRIIENSKQLKLFSFADI